MLKIKNLTVKTENTQILNSVSLNIKPGSINVIMGPNGSGKSTLAKTLIGHPDYEVTGGKVEMDGEDILEMEPNERSNAGLFVAMQYPTEVPGVNLSNFLRLAYNSKFSEKPMPVFKFRRLLREKLEFLGMSEDFMDRNLNEGFSGGEKKKAEILQMAVLEPNYAILDETDSGLDVDALKTVFEGLNKLISQSQRSEKQSRIGLVIITHYDKIFKYIKPDFVHVMRNGKIVESGGFEVVERVQKTGFK